MGGIPTVLGRTPMRYSRSAERASSEKGGENVSRLDDRVGRRFVGKSSFLT